MGVNPTALAATCVMESGCQNTPAGGTGSASGAFQMINSTYTADIAGAVALDPSIADSITPGLAGKMDPGTEAYAAAYELMNDAQVLQNNGIANPTVLDTRAIYQFGQASGIEVANANPSANLKLLVNLSPANMAANGITATTTVGQWQATIANKLRLAAKSSCSCGELIGGHVMRRLVMALGTAAGLATMFSHGVEAVEVDKVIDGYNCMLVDYKALNERK